MALTVGRLKEILNNLDNDAPVVIEHTNNEQLYIRDSDITVEEICESPFEAFVIHTRIY